MDYNPADHNPYRPDTRVSSDNRAVQHARTWLHAKGYGGAWAADKVDVQKAMDRHYEGGYEAFKTFVDAWVAETFGE